MASYNSKKNCFEIENLLENHYFDEINRNLTEKTEAFMREIETLKNNLNKTKEKIIFDNIKIDNSINEAENLITTVDSTVNV